MMGHLICRTCRQELFLGKLFVPDVGLPIFHDPWQSEELVGLKTLRFLAAHLNHDVAILSDGKMESETVEQDVYYSPVDFEFGDRSETGIRSAKRGEEPL